MEERSSLRLTSRDAQLLADLAAYRYLSVSQLQRLHFPSEQTAYRRLRALKADGFIQPFTAPGMNESVFYLTKKGAEYAAASSVEGAAIGPVKAVAEAPKDYYFLKHFLAINDFRIALAKACESSPIKLLGFIPDYCGERSERGGVVKHIRDEVRDFQNRNETIPHTPDGVFALEKEGKAALFFLEVDRGTEVVSDPNRGVLKCLRFYLNYLLTGGYQRYAEEFRVPTFNGFRALIVTSSEQRLQNMREAVKELAFPGKAKRFVWLTTEGKISSEEVFGPIWQSLDTTDEMKYQIG